MGDLFRKNPVVVALAVVAAVLLGVIVVEAALGVGFWARTPASSAKAASAGETKMLPPAPIVVAEQAYPETAARPLFTPTRRPAPAAPTVAGNMQKGQFILTGVIAVGEQRIALLREKTSGKVHRVERGKEVNGLTLSSVENDKVTLAQGGDHEELTLQVQKGAAAAAPAAGAVTHAAGPFAPSSPPGAPGVPPPGPAPSAAAPVTAPPPPTATPGPPPSQGNPAQRFGPFVNPPVPQSTTGGTSEATPMTPEELLARRRARRGQQQPNQ